VTCVASRLLFVLTEPDNSLCLKKKKPIVSEKIIHETHFYYFV